MNVMRLICGAALSLGALAFAGCGSSDSDSPATRTLSSESGAFEATLSADPVDPVVGENKIEMLLSASDDTPVVGANLEIEGEMLAHGHGLGATPTVADRGEGKYTIDRIIYTMPGIWQLTLQVEAGELSDRFKIDYEVH